MMVFWTAAIIKYNSSPGRKVLWWFNGRQRACHKQVCGVFTKQLL